MSSLEQFGAVASLPVEVDRTILRLEAYCRSRDWTGYDPYDALNSEWFGRTPLARSRVARLGFTQLLKRFPVNLRPALRISPRQDPKALALFLMAYVRRARLGDEASRNAARHLAGRLLELRSPDQPYWCWGYSFPWQTRRSLLARFAPNLVVTTCAANALLDAHELGLGGDCLSAAASGGEYIFRELLWHDSSVAGFAYPYPNARVPIHNANFLGAALLCRLASRTGETGGLRAALEVVRYSAACQRVDGSWPYGEGASQQWVDNFHTGFNLCALDTIAGHRATDEFRAVLVKGFAFYRAHFFTTSGAPAYFHNAIYPIDIHSVAQSLITLLALQRLDSDAAALARTVASWAMDHMWDERGFFYYRVLRTTTIRTPYMRWSQAWMLLALLTVAESMRSADHAR